MERLHRRRDGSKLARVKVKCIGRAHKIKVCSPARITTLHQGLERRERRMGIPNPSVGTQAEIGCLFDRGMYRNPTSKHAGLAGHIYNFGFYLEWNTYYWKRSIESARFPSHFYFLYSCWLPRRGPIFPLKHMIGVV
mmetsp:Transcript_9955/g.60901  ORF Transcript_9955/g.60901 Transcript_9955/m.60901 type:complete len:137 (+) Transcript_9955:1449-1859(+)